MTATDDWPADLRGVTETIVTTRGPAGQYNVAALGIHAPCGSGGGGDTAPPARAGAVTARTWGRTRTRANFERRGEGHVQFVEDPVWFVEAALTVTAVEEPVLPTAAAIVRVSVDELDRGVEVGTEWVDWRLDVEESTVRERVVPTINRGFAAVIEATVAASRLDVEGYDSEELADRLDYCEDVARRCGGPVEQRAFDRIRTILDGTV